MSINIIDKIRSAAPADRPLILEKVYDKNLKFFRDRHPTLYQFIERTSCPYHIDVTNTFVDIVETASGRVADPGCGLDRFAEAMGGWTHEAWIDLFNFDVSVNDKYPKHYEPVNDFAIRLQAEFPEYVARFNSGQINLKELGDNKRFSPPVVFLGIFHGLHIAQYLKHSELASALFIEPEPDRFEVSCYFLDYAAIEKRLGTLYLSIGSETDSATMGSFFSLTRITPQLWVRVLPGYQFDQAPLFIESIKSLQATNSNLMYPVDFDLNGLRHGVISLQKKMPILTGAVDTSSHCNIVVVAAGPSLDNDIEWLGENQNNVIIFAVHSSVMVLRKHGIKPDFQFNLDTNINYEGFKKTLLFHDVPFVADYRVPPRIVADFTTPLLCADTYKQSIARFFRSLTETHPSTTNLAVSFACFCKPKTIYLLGCDFGYRDLNQDHAQGTIYENERFKGKETKSLANKSMQLFVKPNFFGTGFVQTIPVHQRTKMVVEACLATNGNGISVINLSDGAQISGAEAQHSRDVCLPQYKDKSSDVQGIQSAFTPAKKGINWEPYVVPGAERLRCLKKDLMKSLSLQDFTWEGFSRTIDAALTKVLVANRSDPNDMRMDVYYRLLTDLLCVWYRCFIFFDDTVKAEQVYRVGFEFFKVALDQLEWPEELDQLAKKV